MPKLAFGNTLILANPASHSGDAARATDIVERILTDDNRRVDSLDIRLTQALGDGATIAAQSSQYDTLLVIGGDGVIHDVVNGLMTLPESKRPRMGIIPMGSGNDFARTLSIPRGNPEIAVRTLLDGKEERLDLGLVNGTYFMQTLSFGLDAQIALDTTDRRNEGTSQRGAALFATSGIKVFSSASKGWEYEATFDGVETISGHELIFACQMGPTYGGGFRVCPKASPTDGLIDICYSALIPPVLVALGIFGAARFGMHTGAKSIRVRQAKTVEINFVEAPPCQVDGEKLEGTHFEIGVAPQVLRTIIPSGAHFRTENA